MALILGSSTVPKCTSCLSRLASSFGEPIVFTATRQQSRGKKTVAKSVTVNVRLLADITSYGKKGSVIPVPPGTMRNNFLPSNRAEYITKEEFRTLGLENTVLVRDTTFGVLRKAVKESKKGEVQRSAPVEIKIQQIEPQKALDIVERLLPANLDFFRTPIDVPTPAPQRYNPSIPRSSALSAEAQEARDAAEAANRGEPQKTSIYGSVSTADIASNLKAVLAEDPQASRIVLAAEDISFVEEGEEQDRVKHLGIFEFEIRIKGASDIIRRTIKVNAQE